MEFRDMLERLSIDELEEVVDEALEILENNKINVKKYIWHLDYLKHERFYYNKKTGQIIKAINKKHAKNLFGVNLEDVISFNYIAEQYFKQTN